MPSAKYIKITAGKLLNKDLLSHIGALFLIAVCFSSFMTIGTILTTIVGDFGTYYAYVVSNCFFYAFAVIMIIPLFFGYAVFETNSIINGKANFSDMFCAFSDSGLFWKSFRVFYALLWRFAVVFAIPVYLIIRFISYTNGVWDYRYIIAGYDLTYTFQVILIIVSVIAAIIIYSRFIISLYITVTRPEKSVSECFYAAKIYRKNCSFSLFCLAASFIPHMILCILSLGIAFIYVIPFMLTSFFVFAHKRYENTELNEAVTNMIFN